MRSEGNLKEKLRGIRLFVTIPDLPPSVNHTYGQNRGRIFKKPEVRRWESIAQYEISKAAREAIGSSDFSSMIGWPVKLTISYIKPSWRIKSGPNKGHITTPDIDNLKKALFDSIFEALHLKNDRSVTKLDAEKIERDGPVRTEILFEFMNEEGN